MMQKENTSLAIYNQWDAPADIMKTEFMYRLEVLQEYSREKRAYTKRDSAYWHEWN